jgi:hypothetical protein
MAAKYNCYNPYTKQTKTGFIGVGSLNKTDMNKLCTQQMPGCTTGKCIGSPSKPKRGFF